MKRAGLGVCVIAGLALARSASAQGGGLVQWGGGGEVGLRWEAAEGRTTARPSVTENNLRGWFGASLQGQVLDRRWLAYTWGVRPGFVRSDGNQPSSSSATDDLAHQLTLRTQPFPWLSAHASSDRDRVVAQRGADASRESRFTRTEGRGDLRLPFATLGALARRESADDRWTSTSLAPELERHVRRRSAEAWLESSRMRLAERRTRETVPESRDVVSTRQTTFDHAFTWGHGSALRTRLEWSSQSPTTVTLVDRLVQENLRLRHTSWLVSDYSFHREHIRFTSGEGIDRSHAFDLSARTDGVGLGLSAALRDDRSPGREGREWSAGPRASWQRAWRSGARVSSEAGVLFDAERRTGAADARIAVVNEGHAVTASQTFALEQEGVDSATVVLRDAAGTAGFVPGIDYELVRSGTRLFVVIPFGSRIAEGDVVRVSYEATPPGTPRRRGLRADFALSGDWRGVTVRVEDRQRVVRDTPLDRGAAALGSRERSASATAALPRGPARLDLAGTARRRTVEGRTASTGDVRATLSWRVGPTVIGALDALRSSASEPGGRLVATVYRGRLDWAGARASRWSVHADRSRYARARAKDVRQSSAGAEMSTRWDQLEGSLRLDLVWQDGEPAGHRSHRLSLGVVRRL